MSPELKQRAEHFFGDSPFVTPATLAMVLQITQPEVADRINKGLLPPPKLQRNGAIAWERAFAWAFVDGRWKPSKPLTAAPQAVGTTTLKPKPGPASPVLDSAARKLVNKVEERGRVMAELKRDHERNMAQIRAGGTAGKRLDSAATTPRTQGMGHGRPRPVAVQPLKPAPVAVKPRAVGLRAASLTRTVVLDEVKPLSAEERAAQIAADREARGYLPPDDQWREWVPAPVAVLDGVDAGAEWLATPPELVTDDNPLGNLTLDAVRPVGSFHGHHHIKASPSSRVAVGATRRARRIEHETSSGSKARHMVHRVAHYAHLGAMHATTGKSHAYHATMAKFHGERGRAQHKALDSATNSLAGRTMEDLAHACFPRVFSRHDEARR